MYVWGGNYYGQLGLGYEPDSLYRHLHLSVELEISEQISEYEFKKICIVDVACGADYTMALTIDERIFSMGRNLYGQLGLGDMVDRYRSEEIKLCGVKSVACGFAHTIALTRSDELYVWGYNRHGQLGLGDGHTRTSPRKLILGPSIKSISCGYMHTVILTKQNEIYGCGNNIDRQLGIDGDFHCQFKKLILTHIDSVSCGHDYTICITMSGKIYVWGSNKFGQLGLGDTCDRKVPTELKF